MTGKVIRGSGGDSKSGGSQHVATEDSDSLRSIAYANVVDLLCEGEIEGLVDGAKSIYLDGVPLMNPDGTLNYKNVSWSARTGTPNQDYIPGFDSIQNEVVVQQKILHFFPVVRQITDLDVDRVRVRVSVPQLTSQDTSNGDIHGNTVSVSIWLQPNGGSYQQVKAKTISGKSSSKYETQIDVPLSGSGPWNIRVQRDTADSLSQASINDVYLESYTEVVDAKLNYPNSALVAISVDSRNFSSIPSRYFDVKLLKIRVPSNYDPETRTYTGTWDGTFQVLWSDNPAWCFYDLLTSERYGLGGFVSEDQVDKWALYQIAKYCDELVPDGSGGMEPRFTCNLLLNSREEAYTVLQNMASIFRAMVYWSAGSVTAVQDAPQDPSYLFTPANVVDGKFTYQGAATKARHTVALVTWNDPQDSYTQKVEYVEDQDAIARYGVNETSVVAFGCTSRGQAHRYGKWLLYTEQFESETVTFKTGLEGVVQRPGEVVAIADPARAGLRMGGRISNASAEEITIDADLSFDPSNSTLSVLFPDGTIGSSTVVSSSGRALQVDPPFSQIANAQSIWMLKTPQVEAQTYRVIGVKENDDSTYSVTALRHDPGKFASVELGISLAPRQYSILSAAPAAPKNLKITESLYQTGSEVKTKITISWDKVDFATQYSVKYQKDNDNFIELAPVSINDVEVLDAAPGFYTAEVVALNALGSASTPASASAEVYGKTAAPSNMTGFSLIPTNGTAVLTWDAATDLDVIVGGSVRIRYTPKTSGQAWKDAVDIAQKLPGTATSAIVPLVDGTYLAKFVDSSGNFSTTEAIISASVPYVQALNVVNVQAEDPGFPGSKSGLDYLAAQQAISLSSILTVDDVPDWDSLGNVDFMGGVSASGVYDFENTVDLGGVWPARLTALIETEAFDVGNFIDQRTDLMDSWPDIDGAIINDVNAELYVRTTNDDPSGTPTWSDWCRFIVGESVCRAYQFQLRVTTSQSTHNVYIRRLQVTIDMADRTINLTGLDSGTGSTYRVNYDEGFFAPPAIAVTGNNMQSGDYFTITGADESGFNIVFKNASGTTVERSFNVLAKGYGRRIA